MTNINFLKESIVSADGTEAWVTTAGLALLCGVDLSTLTKYFQRLTKDTRKPLKDIQDKLSNPMVKPSNTKFIHIKDAKPIIDHYKNKAKYGKKAKKKTNPEERACLKFAENNNCQLEVPIQGVGRVDIITDEYIIEVKSFGGWKGAMGQVQAYGFNYKEGNHGLELVVALYGLNATDDLTIAKRTLKEMNVRLACIDSGSLVFID